MNTEADTSNPVNKENENTVKYHLPVRDDYGGFDSFDKNEELSYTSKLICGCYEKERNDISCICLDVNI